MLKECALRVVVNRKNQNPSPPMLRHCTDWAAPIALVLHAAVLIQTSIVHPEVIMPEAVTLRDFSRL
jgi:hypothetical protein